MFTHITKAEELYLGVGEDETDDQRKSNLIFDSNDLQEVNEDLESQQKKSRQVQNTSITLIYNEKRQTLDLEDPRTYFLVYIVVLYTAVSG